MERMDWKPTQQKGTPFYKQIAEHLERRISYGEFPAGSFLPSERTLARELNVNRSTIVAAYEELRAEGLVESIQGSGTRVSHDIWGLTKNRVPNWRHLVESGSFLPNLPLIQRIRKETQENGLIDLASGELSADLFPTASFQTIMATQQFDGHLGYDHPQGHFPLRETICEHVSSLKRIEATPDSILITSGAQQALHLVVQCLLKPGDAVAIEDPSYSYSLPLFQSAGLRTFLLPVEHDGINPEELIALHRKHRIKMVFVNPTYQNPTGTTMSMEKRLRLLDISTEYGIPIVEDDPYSLITFAGKQMPTLKSLDRHGTVLYISSLTKIVASGLRIGWVIGPQTVIQRLADAKQQVDFGHSIFPQWIAQRFLASAEFDAHIELLTDALHHKRDAILSALTRHLKGQVDTQQPDGGIHLWCKVKAPVKDTPLLKEAIRAGVVYVPGNVLSSKEGYVRFTYGHAPLHLIDEAIERFSQALQKLL